MTVIKDEKINKFLNAYLNGCRTRSKLDPYF